ARLVPQGRRAPPWALGGGTAGPASRELPEPARRSLDSRSLLDPPPAQVPRSRRREAPTAPPGSRPASAPERAPPPRPPPAALLRCALPVFPPSAGGGCVAPYPALTRRPRW